MAIYHCSVRTLSRAKGHSAVAAACYRAGVRIIDERTGIIHNYQRREGVARSFIILPRNAPDDYAERATLWNEAERSENRKNSRIAREVIIALPHELDEKQRFVLTRAFALFLCDRYKVGVDIAIHKPSPQEGHDQRNHHAHLLFTTRKLGPDGFDQKTRSLDDKMQGPQEIEAIRYGWEHLANKALENAGLDERIDRRTLIAQGIERIPQMHMGPKAFALYLQNKQLKSKAVIDGNQRVINYPLFDQGSRADFNDKIIALNLKRDELPKLPLELQIKNIDALIEMLSSKIEALQNIVPRSLLPEYIKRRLEAVLLKIMALFLKEQFYKALAEKALHRKNETLRLHKKIEDMRRKIKELEEKRRSAQLFKLFIDSIKAQLKTHSAFYESGAIPSIITSTLFNERMRIKAREIRMSVPANYRPNFYLLDKRKKDNGGLIAPPPPLSNSFNENPTSPRQVKAYAYQIKG